MFIILPASTFTLLDQNTYMKIKDAVLSVFVKQFTSFHFIFSSHPSILPTHGPGVTTSPWSLVIRRSRSSHRPLAVRHGATFDISADWAIDAGCLSCLSCLAPGHPCHPFREADGVVEGSLPKKIHSKASLCIFQKMEKNSMFLRPLCPLSPLIRKRSLTSLLLWGLLNETEGESKPIKDCSPSVDLDGPLVTMKGLKGPKSRRSWRQKIARRNPNV